MLRERVSIGNDTGRMTTAEYDEPGNRVSASGTNTVSLV